MKTKKKKPERIVSTGTVLPDGTIIEAVYDESAGKTAFLVGNEHHQSLREKVILTGGEEMVPPRATNNLIRHNVLLLPSATKEYGDADTLLWSIEAYLKTYCDLPAEFIKTSAAYIMLSWVYDRFNELPYLRLTGSFGTGKTRFLLTVGSVAYRPIFASGASTISPIFHSLNEYRGTLVMDEADFRFSDEKADVTKILNNGNVKGIPILRCVKNSQGEFNPHAFNVFGPKIVVTRGRYEDPALESRFITEEVQTKKLRADIPINMPAIQKQEALELRNQLLLFRFEHWHRTDIRPGIGHYDIDGRVAQIFRPLLSVVDNEEDRDVVAAFAMRAEIEQRKAHLERVEVRVLRALIELSSKKEPLSLKAIIDNTEAEYGLSLSPRGLGHILRSKLGLVTVKRNGNYVVHELSEKQLETLARHFGLKLKAASEKPPKDEKRRQSLPLKTKSPTSPKSSRG